jgi:ZIP family zinc transporter
MPNDLLLILATAGPAALASPIGGLLALWRKPTSLFMSIALGFASGVLLATVCFEMLPQAEEASSLAGVVAGFVGGFAVVYGFDLYVHRGVVAGEKAEQQSDAKRFYVRNPPRGDRVTVLAGGTSIEELIEGLAIGVGFALKPGLAIFIALAILIDNISEALSIGLLIRDRPKIEWREVVWRTLRWTGLIAVSLLGSAVVGWLFLRGLPREMLGALLAAGAGGMFYLTVTDLLPEAEERHYQQSAAMAVTAGFMTIFILGQFY